MLEDIDKVYEMALDIIEDADKAIDKMLPRNGPGTHRPTDMELMQWIQQVNMTYPPQWFMRPDGNPVFASPYLLALAECENGKETMKRVQRLMTPEVA